MKLSIITPSFRNSQWLKLCVASIADQQGVDAEHIVQDAGSDDGTLDWLTHDPRVQAYVEKDKGMYDAINRGLRRACGEILAYLNCDEQYLPGTLKKVSDAAKKHGKAAGILVHNNALVPKVRDLGYTFTALGSDGGAVRGGLLGFVAAFLLLANAGHLGGRLVHEFGVRAPVGEKP